MDTSHIREHMEVVDSCGNHVGVGVYSAVEHGGTIRRGDPVRLD